MSLQSANSLKWKVALPAALIVTVYVWGLATRTLTGIQLLTLIPMLFGLVVPTVGIFAFRPHPKADDEVIPDDELPMVTILIPAHNEELVIANTVQNMMKLDYPRFEIIVIDDHSTDHTGDILRTLPVKTVTRRNLPNRGKSEALNAGFEHAEGDVICVFDADSEVAPNFLRLAVAPMVNDPEVCGVQAQVRIYNRKYNFLTAGQDDEFAIYSELSQSGRSAMRIAVCLGGNGQLTRRSAVEAVGGWSPQALTEDLDLSIRLLVNGHGRIAHSSEAIVNQEAVVTMKALLRQRSRWSEGMLRAYGEFFMDILKSKHLSLAMRVDAMFILCSVFLPLFSVFAIPMAVLIVATHYFPAVIADSTRFAWPLTIGIVAFWSIAVSFKRDRRFDPIPGLRYIVFSFHWVAALLLAIRNIMADKPVVWAKTEHVGQDRTAIAASQPSLAGMATVGAPETHPAA
jgi:1,2-diacylglycerol 3-beta-glucosyltransferase